MITTTLTISLLLYATATGLLLQQWLSAKNGLPKTPSFVASIAVIFHAVALYSLMFTSQGIDIGFYSALTFTAWLMASLLVIASFTLPIGCLGLLVYPFALVTILLRATSDQQHILTNSLAAGLEAHILFSLIYAILSLLTFILSALFGRFVRF